MSWGGETRLQQPLGTKTTGKKRDLSRDVVNVFAADITTTNIEYVSLFSLKKKNHDQTRRQLGLSLKEAKENWSSAPSGCTA